MFIRPCALIGPYAFIVGTTLICYVTDWEQLRVCQVRVPILEIDDVDLWGPIAAFYFSELFRYHPSIHLVLCTGWAELSWYDMIHSWIVALKLGGTIPSRLVSRKTDGSGIKSSSIKYCLLILVRLIVADITYQRNRLTAWGGQEANVLFLWVIRNNFWN